MDMTTPFAFTADSARSARAPETAADHILRYLADQGVEAIFGIPGGHISPFLGALRRQDRIRFVIARHEGGAAFMADGYARASGRPGVCLVTAGPGVTNALTGVAAAHLDGVPLLLLSGQVPTNRFGLGAMQESTGEVGVDVVATLRHASAFSAPLVDPRSLGRQLGRAFAVLGRRPGGAVHLSIPANLAREPIDHAEVSRWRRWEERRTPKTLAPRTVTQRVLLRLTGAQRPLVYLGSGAREALGQVGEAFLEWAESHGIAVVTSPRAKGIVSERSAVALGAYGLGGSQHAEHYLRRGVDALLIVGSRLGEWSSNNFSRDLGADFVAQVDLDEASIGRVLAVDLPIVADAESFLGDLLQLAASGPPPDGTALARLRELATLQAEVPRQIAPTATVDDSTPAKPQRVMAALDRHLTGTIDLYVDIGNCAGWASHCLQVAPPARVFVPYGLSTMGWSCGAVIGGKIARPERRALALLGDGAFLMNGAELSTAAKHQIGAVYLVLDDDALGMVNHGEHLQTGHPLDDGYYGLGNPDLAAFARALGADAHVADTATAVDDALDAAFAAADAHHRPQVIIARIDPREVPPYGERFRAVGGR